LKFVLDASVAIRWFITGTEHREADKILKILIEEPGLFAVPELFTYEVLAVLYRHHPKADLVYSEDINRILHSGILRYPMTENIFTKADSFIKAGLTGYDAVYAALAQEIGALWLTYDTKAHNKIIDFDISVDLFHKGIEQFL